MIHLHEYLLYIDPGSGSYLIQVIIAAVFGAWFWLKNYFKRIKTFFKKDNDRDSKDDLAK